MPDTPLTEAELRVEFLNISHATLAELCAELVCKLRAARADLEQAAKDYAVAKKEAFRISDWPVPDWLKRVQASMREREGKNG